MTLIAVDELRVWRFSPLRSLDVEAELRVRFPLCSLVAGSPEKNWMLLVGPEESWRGLCPWFAGNSHRVHLSTPFVSISEGGKLALECVKKHGFCSLEHVPLAQARRGELIAEWVAERVRFRKHSARVLCFSLIDEHKIIVWEENRTEQSSTMLDPIVGAELAPSRAYAKLEQALAAFDLHIKPGDSLWDIGASPGGFTWFARQKGAQVTAFDRQPLRDDLMQDPNVVFHPGDAFALFERDKIAPNYLVWDIACVPARAMQALGPWSQAMRTTSIVAVMKLKGDVSMDLSLLMRFQQSYDGQFVHLPANKHELVWVRPGIQSS